jgi:hypothetical protein
MKTEIVIARYNEDLSWLKKLPKSIKITIYNKGNDNIEYPFIKLPNIGRESHTYLYHIINNYDKLADQTIFCQGDSIFHSPGFLNLIKNRKMFQPVQPLTAFYWPDGEKNKSKYPCPPPILLKYTKDLWIKGNPIHVEYIDNNYITRYPYFYLDRHIEYLIDSMEKLYGINNLLKFDIERFNLKNIDPDYLIPTHYAAQFSVNRDVIRENSIDFYNNIMNILIYDLRYLDNEKIFDTGHILEKLWLVIFNYMKYNKNYIPIKIDNTPLYNIDLTIKNNSIKFSLDIKLLHIYIQLFIDNQLYKIILLSNRILFKSINKKLLKIKLNDNYKNQNIINIINMFKNVSNINNINNTNHIIIDIKLKNNYFTLLFNNIKIINYHFKYKIKNINSAKIFTITNENKFTDLLL